jgi:hypothetical protein
MNRNWQIWSLIRNYFLLIWVLIGSIANAQEKKCLINFSNTYVPVILDSIGTSFGVFFSYDADMELVKKIKSIDTTGTLHEILNLLFNGEKIGFSFVGQNVVLYKKNNNFSEEFKVNVPDSLAFKLIQGKIFDKNTHATLSFATISNSGKNIGTTANINGEFVFKVPAKFYNDSLIVTYIGYKTFAKAIKELQMNEPMNIMLEANTLVMAPIIVKPVDVLEILRKVMEKISDNYSNKPVSYTAFFRESTHEDDEYITVCEAIVDIYKSSYENSFIGDEVKLFKGRKTEDKSKIKKIRYKLEGGIMNCLRLDLIKERASFLSPDFFDSYDYKYEKTVMFDGHELYVISFDQKEDIQSPLYKGLIYIEKNTYALVAAKFSLSPKGMKYAQNLLVKKYPRKYKVKPVSTLYQVNYRNINGKWHLDYIRGELQIKAKSDKFLFNTLYTSVSEMSITEIDTVNVKKFKLKEIITDNDATIDCIGLLNENFWGKYNVIKPEEPIIEAIHKLSIKQNLVPQHKNFWESIF